MAKRRVYEPDRDRGWSNGKYWQPKRRHASDPDDDLYDAWCSNCKAAAPHQWDECIPCGVSEKQPDPSEPKKDEGLNAFGRDLASP